MAKTTNTEESIKISELSTKELHEYYVVINELIARLERMYKQYDNSIRSDATEAVKTVTKYNVKLSLIVDELSKRVNCLE